MTDAAECSFRCLVLDAVDAPALAAFWAGVMGRPVSDEGDDGLLIRAADDPERELLWVDRVPEERSGRTRVRLDLQLPAHDVAPLLAAGARLVSTPRDGAQWWVLEDPEGNELTAMPPPPPELHVPPVDAPTPYELVVDAADPHALAQWWAERTGGASRRRPTTSFSWVEGAAAFPYLFWMFVPETSPRTVKNRMHWDVVLRDEDPAALVAAGAVVLREPAPGTDWWVLADPEGNEFCAFAPTSA